MSRAINVGHGASVPERNGHYALETNGQAGGLPHGSSVAPIGELMSSPLNPRKTFHDGETRELADSLKSLGMLQPILVRRRTLLDRGAAGKSRKLGPSYEIADGDRRYRAAQLAGLAEVPILVRELTDRQMLEVMIVSFEQRADVSPSEKGAGYQRLIDLGATVQEIAQQVGKSPSSIRALLKVAKDLPAIAAAALAAGEIAQSTAELIARVPGADARERLALMVLCGERFGGRQSGLKPSDVQKYRDDGIEPMSFRETQDVIEQWFTRELKQAPFSRKSLELLPAAGSCDACPKRAGNDPDAFAGARADVCTDPTCYEAKVAAHAQAQLRLAQESGKTVLDGAAADKIFCKGQPAQLAYNAPYLDLGTVCYADNKNRTYAKVLGKAVEADVVVAVDPAGGVHKLLARAAADKALKAAGFGTNQGGSTGNESWRREQRKAAARAKLGQRAGAIALAAVAQKMQTLGRVIGWSPEAVELLRAVVVGLAGATVSHDMVRAVERAHKLKTEGKAWSAGDSALVAHLRTVGTAGELLTIVAELVGARLSLGWGNAYMDGGGGKDPFWKTFGVDKAALMRRVTAESKEKSAKGKKTKAASKRRTPKAAPGDEDDEDGDVGEVDAKPSSAAGSDADWRRTALDLVEVLDSPDVAHLREQGMRNLGQVADGLQGGRYLGLKQKVVTKLVLHIETLRTAEGKPSAAETLAARVQSRKCAECRRTAAANPELMFDDDDLCAECAEKMEHAQ